MNKLFSKIATKLVSFILRYADHKTLIDLYDKSKKLDKLQRYDLYKRKYKIPKSFQFNGNEILFYGEGQLICGENSYIGSYSTIYTHEGHYVSIGEKCSISHNVRIYTLTTLADQDLSTSKNVYKAGNVKIGNYVWIGANVFINPGIEIGDNVVVGANSVVTKNIEANSIVGGVPAHLIKIKNWGKHA